MIRFDNHAFKGLDQSLRRLFDLLQAMGGNVEQLIAMLPAALEAGQPEMFAEAKQIDKRINQAELEVDATVAATINKFTIMGEDLRFTLASLKIAGTLERTADKLKNCIKRLSRIGTPLELAVKQELAIAISAVEAMVPLALAQLVDYTPDTTEALLRHGATVQQAYRTSVLTLHAHNKAPDDTTHILLVAKNLEQASDMLIDIMKTCHYVHLATKYEKAEKVAS